MKNYSSQHTINDEKKSLFIFFVNPMHQEKTRDLKVIQFFIYPFKAKNTYTEFLRSQFLSISSFFDVWWAHLKKVCSLNFMNLQYCICLQVYIVIVYKFLVRQTIK